MASLPDPTMKQAAWGKSWYINADRIEVFGQSYVKYGLPRVLRPGDVDYATDYMGVAIALDPRATGREVVYLLTNAEGCEFQPYRIEPAPSREDEAGDE